MIFRKKYNVYYQVGGDIFIDEITDTRFSGAGILLLEKINNRWVLILIRDHTKTYADPGGNYELTHENLAKTATEELREESRNLLHIINHHSLNNYVDTYSNYYRSYYRSYIININGIKEDDFLHNMNIIDTYNRDKGHVNGCWRETSGLKKFYLDDLFESINKFEEGKFSCKDINQNVEIIRKRIFDILKAFKNKENLINLIPIELHKKFKIYQYDVDKPFLENTKNYQII